MDWDLWGPSYNQVSLDRSNDTQPGSQFDYYFGYVPDMLEETALNEKYCVQVLGIMNTKADVEIDQLEEDLLVLQSQLVWTEDEERSDKCCAALRGKIDDLNSTIWSLRNKEEHDVDAYLSVHREPAEKLHEIMKVLLKNYLEKDEQPLDVIVREPISHTSRHATGLGEGKQFSKFDSIIAVKQEIQEPTFAPSENCIAPNSPPKPEAKKSDFLKEVKTEDIIVKSTKVDASEHMTDHSNGKKTSHVSELRISREEVSEHRSTSTAKDMILDPSLESEEKKTDLSGIIKPLDVIVKETSSDSLGLTTDHLDERKKVSNFDSNRAVKEEIWEPTVAPSGNCTAPTSSSKPEGKETVFLREVETLDIIDRSPKVDPSKHVTGYSNGKNKSHHSELKITTEEVNKRQSLLAKDMILDPSLEPGEKNTNPRGKVKPANTIIKASNLETSKPASVCSDRSKSLCKPVSKVHGMEKVNEPKSTATDRSITLNSFPKCAGKGTNIPKANKPVDATVRNFGSDSLRHAIGLHCNNGKKNLSNSSSSLNATGPGKSGDSIVKSKEINSTSENTRNGCINESKVALTGKNDSSNSLLKIEEKTSPILTGKVQDAGITVVSNVDLQVQHEKDTTQQKSVEKRKTQPCDGQKDDIVANDKSNLNCPLKSQRLKEPQRRFPPSSGNVQDAGITVVSNVDLQVQQEKDTTQQKLVEKRKTQPCDGQNDDIVANDKSNLNCPLKSQRLKEPQRRFPRSSMSVQEGSVSMSSISKAKKRRKSSIDDNVTLVEIKNETKWKKFLDQDRCGAQVCGVASDVSKKSVPRSQKIRKKCPDSPIILGLTNFTFQKDLQKLHRDTTGAASEEVNRITNSRSTGISDNEAVPSLPASRLNYLHDLPKVDLRAIAKQYKLSGYYALKKSDLIQQIATRLQ